MPANPLQPFLTSWQTRLAQAQKAGINPASLQPVFQMDLKRLQAGSVPLTNDQAAVAIGAAAGTPPISAPKPKTGFMDILGNAGKDIGEIGKGLITLPKAIVHDVSHIGEMPGQIAKGAGEIAKGDIGHGLQDIASAPGLQELLIASDFIPGVGEVTAPITAGVLAGGVAGKAMTPEGRTDIAQHPLINFLNVLPALSEAHLTGMAAKAVQESAVGAASSKVLDDLGVSSRYREAWRMFSDARKQAHDQVAGFMDNAKEMFGKHSPEEMAQITQALKSGDPAVLAQTETAFPGFMAMKQNYDQLQGDLSQDPQHFVHLKNPDSGVTDVYPIKSLPDKTFTTLNRFKGDLAKATDHFGTTEKNLMDAEVAARSAEAAMPDVAALQKRLSASMDAEIADKGLGNSKIAPAIDSLRKGQYGQAASLLRRAGMTDAADTVSRIPQYQQEFVDAQKRVQTIKDSQTAAGQKIGEIQKKVTRQEQAFRKALDRKPAARWHPNITNEFHNRVEAWAQDFYSKDPARLDKAVSEIGDRYYGGSFEDGTPIFPAKVLRQMEKDSVAQIAKWQKDGWDPSFVHTVTESQVRNLRYPQVARRTEPQIGSFKEKLLNSSGREEVDNVAISLTHQQAEVAVNDLWNKTWNGYTGPDGIKQEGLLQKFGKTNTQLMEELRARGLSPDAARREVAKEWENPKRFARVNSGPFARNNVLIPRSLAKNIDRLTPTLGPDSSIKAIVDKTTRGYRFAVTGLSPQHVVHIVASGGVMLGMTMRDLPTTLSSIGEARAMIKEGRMPVRFAQEASQLPEEDTMLFGNRDRSAVRLYTDTVAKGVHPLQRINTAVNHFDEHVTQWYKTLDYVAQTRKGLDPEEALNQVAHHFADHAGRAPLERAIFKSYVPFGSWTQHLIQFAFRFPADHPLRAAVLANLATAELEDTTSGLPRNFAQLFFLGDKAFDIRSFNPFRDIGRDFTLAGFISSLNPAVEALFQSKGYNPITDSAELYPELQVDPNTGKLQTVSKNFPRLLGEALVPQVSGVEALLGWSDSMRKLKASNPSAYASTLARYLHFPWLPRTVNLPQERATEELNITRVASTDVSNAMKTGDFSKLNQYNQVPYQGHLVQPQMLENLYKLLASKNTGYTPNTLLRK